MGKHKLSKDLVPVFTETSSLMKETESKGQRSTNNSQQLFFGPPTGLNKMAETMQSGFLRKKE